MTNNDTDFLYALFESGRLNLMYLPSGAVAWLWSRPSPQVDAAENLAVASHSAENPIVDACLLRSDQNVLILKCAGGQKFRVYPDGGYSFDGYPMNLDGCRSALENVPEHETCSCGCGGTCGCAEEPHGEPEDSVREVPVPPGFRNYADEGIGGETNLVPRHGGPDARPGTPYTDVATDIIAQMDLLDPEHDLEHMGKSGDYTDDEMRELARAMGSYEYSLESEGEDVPPKLVDLATRAREVYDAAVKDLGPDLGGFSVLDLLADNFPDISLRTLEDAIVVAGIPRDKSDGESLTFEDLLDEQGPSPIVQLARKVKNVYDAAVNRLGPDLGGKSPYEFLADYFSHISPSALQDAMSVADIPYSQPMNEQGKVVPFPKQKRDPREVEYVRVDIETDPDWGMQYENEKMLGEIAEKFGGYITGAGTGGGIRDIGFGFSNVQSAKRFRQQLLRIRKLSPYIFTIGKPEVHFTDETSEFAEGLNQPMVLDEDRLSFEDVVLMEKKVDKRTVESYLKSWKHEDAAEYARKLVKKFGPPDEAAQSCFIWRSISLFDETYIKDESIPHGFPKPHRDFVYSTVEQPVPPEMMDTLAQVSGSIIIDGLKNTVTARCGGLLANAVTVGFVEDLVIGKIPEDAKKAKKEYERRITKGVAPHWYKDEMGEK